MSDITLPEVSVSTAPAAASGLLDEIMAQTRFKPESESYDIARQGVLDLQQRRNSLSDKHLRPLEDNPLRLNMDYTAALDVMFAEGKSPVHLAAPAAVGESLRNVRHHEEANRAAIVESLRVLLDAFSPQSLMRRFVQYRRSHELRQPLDDAGAWQMYSHYYDELASDRQQGFEMLFNEVYAQVYDRVLREKQREPEA